MLDALQRASGSQWTYAAVFWGSYAGLLGYLGGRTFEGVSWRGLVLALALAGAVAVGVEAIRRVRRGPAATRGRE